MATDVRTRPQTDDIRIDFRASWELYLALSEALEGQHILLAYDGARAELMSPGMLHGSYNPHLHRLVAALADGVGMLCLNIGSGRVIRPEARRGLEPDEAFYFSARKVAVVKLHPKEDTAYPIPDLAIEIDFSPSQIDRPGIYAALGVPEVWRFDGEEVRIDRLEPDGSYSAAAASAFLGVTPAEIMGLLEIEILDHNDFARKVTAWAAAELRPRRPSWALP